MTLIVEVEGITNTRPLTKVYEELKSGFVLIPAHFLTGNHKLAVPFSEDVCEDSNYYPKIDCERVNRVLAEKSKTTKFILGVLEARISTQLFTIKA